MEKRLSKFNLPFSRGHSAFTTPPCALYCHLEPNARATTNLLPLPNGSNGTLGIPGGAFREAL